MLTTGESSAWEVTMKYVTTWKPRSGGSAAENEASAARLLEMYSVIWQYTEHHPATGRWKAC